MHVLLSAHPETLWPPVHQFSVEIRRRGDRLWLQYSLMGELDRVRWPDPAPAERTDGLWKHTCFEAFIRVGTAYYEFNLSTSGQWASYRFDDYRKGMVPAAQEVTLVTLDGRTDYRDIGALFDLPAGADLLGVAAVIEDVDGGISYWAFNHPSDKPDFHHPDSFALVIPALELP
ncbi:MAG: DOMON-like domain-containing protein [Acetobacteraceae bacterium]|nr:MAG: DOMON-like domain-containing protein [Acetobacteraceae bacterium]